MTAKCLTPGCIWRDDADETRESARAHVTTNPEHEVWDQ